MSEIDSMLAAVADAPAEMLEPALELLIKMYTAIIDKPNEPKVRRIRWMNAKVQQYLASVPIAQDFLLASGFCIVESPVEGSATAETEDVIVFKDGSSMTLLAEARGRLTRTLALVRSGARTVSSRLSTATFFKAHVFLRPPITTNMRRGAAWTALQAFSQRGLYLSVSGTRPPLLPPRRRPPDTAPQRQSAPLQHSRPLMLTC